MAFYIYAFRDVRNRGASENPSGTKDAPRVESTVKKFFVEKGSAPLAADLLVPLKTLFPQLAATDTAWYIATASAAATANSNTTNRANDAVTIDGFRDGKAFMQFGCGTGATAAAAEAAINWKNL